MCRISFYLIYLFCVFFTCLWVEDLIVSRLEVIRPLLHHPSDEKNCFKERCAKLQIESSPLPGAEVSDDVICLTLEVCGVLAGFEEVTS